MLSFGIWIVWVEEFCTWRELGCCEAWHYFQTAEGYLVVYHLKVALTLQGRWPRITTRSVGVKVRVVPSTQQDKIIQVDLIGCNLWCNMSIIDCKSGLLVVISMKHWQSFLWSKSGNTILWSACCSMKGHHHQLHINYYCVLPDFYLYSGVGVKSEGGGVLSGIGQ